VLKGIYTYQRRENLIPVEGVEYEAFRSIGDIRVRDGSEAAFLAAGNGALIGHRLAERYNWRVGETVAMVEGPTVVVAGILSSPNAAYEREILLHKSYLEGLMRDDGESTYLAVKVANAGAVAPVSRSIDTMFANHPRPTKTQSEKSTREQQARDYDAIRFMLSGMVLATLLACLFGAANSVSMSARERTREVGILRSLGFRRMHVLALLTGESTFIAVFGGLIGIGASWLLLASEKMLGGIVPVTVTPLTVAIGVGMAILVGLLGAIVPAVAATRVKIVDTLRFVD
jgi:putative ABC transport system permease protein